MKRRELVWVAAGLAAAVIVAVWSLGAQQLGGSATALKESAKRDLSLAVAYRTEPGGTPEDRLWQVQILMGAGDREPASWNGRLSIEKGEIHAIDGYRFELPDRILPQGGWQMRTVVTRVLLSYATGEGPGASESRVLPKGLMVRGSGGVETRVAVETEHGRFDFAPAALPFGVAEKRLDGRVEIRRIPPATDLSGTELRQHDFSSIAAGRDGTLWAVWSSYHDRREELNFRRYKDGRWTRLIPVSRAAEDLWRPQVAVDAAERPWLIWSQQVNGNWDLYAMPWEGEQWGRIERLTTNPLPDIDPHVARAGDGTIYVVWQSLTGRTSQIRLKYLKDGKWSQMVNVTTTFNNDWEPAVAAGTDGRAWIAWDRYNSSYDVYCRGFSPAAGLGPEMKVAGSERFEAHVSVAVDQRNRPWVAWERGAANWGKDFGAFIAADKKPGAPLGRTRSIEIAVLDGQEWKAPAPVKFSDSLAEGATEESVPLLFAGPDGAMWMAFKRRYSRHAFRPSIFWETYLTRLDGDRWADPLPLPNSWTRKSVRMGLAAANGRLWAFWPSESRDYAFASRPHSGRVIAGSVVPGGAAAEPKLAAFEAAPDAAPPSHPNEAKDLAGIHGYRAASGGETLRIVRGDLHRHTELSQDTGGLDDGSLPEFYRYMIDVAAMDFGASTDHQAGGTDYWNFLTLKMTDMFRFPERFTPFYAYERNLGYPFGHRNIIHTGRNYPIVPFFQRIDNRFMLPDTPDGELLTFNSMAFGSGIRNDTKLLYEELRKTRGLAIPHTSATDSMGTDWGDNDRKLEPVVEIYQGCRQNYEHKNAPRGIYDGEEKKTFGGFQEGGLVWNAWKKGYRLGVIASSDHFSTHISYAMVYTPGTSRRAIFDAILKRHTYGATDNIVLEFRLGDHFMGDDFTAAGAQKIRVKALGTAPISAIHLIRDAKYIHKTAPNRRDAEFEFLDNEVSKGEHWYYVRVEQSNGELAWSSPIWVKYQ